MNEEHKGCGSCSSRKIVSKCFVCDVEMCVFCVINHYESKKCQTYMKEIENVQEFDHIEDISLRKKYLIEAQKERTDAEEKIKEEKIKEEKIKAENELLHKAGKMCGYGDSFNGFCRYSDNQKNLVKDDDDDKYYCIVHLQNVKDHRRFKFLNNYLKK